MLSKPIFFFLMLFFQRHLVLSDSQACIWPQLGTLGPATRLMSRLFNAATTSTVVSGKRTRDDGSSAETETCLKKKQTGFGADTWGHVQDMLDGLTNELTCLM